MKKLGSILSIVFMGVLLFACVPGTQQTASPSFDEAGTLQVTVSVLPQKWFVDRIGGGLLHTFNLLLDVLRGHGGLLGQFLDLIRHNGKSFTRLTGTRRLDGGIKRQQIGLLGDLGDRLGDLVDGLSRLSQLGHFA